MSGLGNLVLCWKDLMKIRHWNRIQECPSGVNGPIDWKEYNCHVLVPKNTTKIRPVLNAGYSSNEEEQL